MQQYSFVDRGSDSQTSRPVYVASSSVALIALVFVRSDVT